MKDIEFACNDMIYIGFAVKERSQYNYGDDPDISLLLLNKEQLLETDDDFLFYNQSSLKNKSIILEYQYFGTGSDDQFAFIDFGSIPEHIENMRFIITRHADNSTELNYELTIRITSKVSDIQSIPSNFEHSLTKCFRLDSSKQMMYLFDIIKKDSNWYLSFTERIEHGDLCNVYEQYAKK